MFPPRVERRSIVNITAAMFHCCQVVKETEAERGGPLFLQTLPKISVTVHFLLRYYHLHTLWA